MEKFYEMFKTLPFYKLVALLGIAMIVFGGVSQGLFGYVPVEGMDYLFMWFGAGAIVLSFLMYMANALFDLLRMKYHAQLHETKIEHGIPVGKDETIFKKSQEQGKKAK